MEKRNLLIKDLVDSKSQGGFLSNDSRWAQVLGSKRLTWLLSLALVAALLFLASAPRNSTGRERGDAAGNGSAQGGKNARNGAGSARSESEPYKTWRAKREVDRRRLEDAGFSVSSTGVGFAFLDENAKVVPGSLEKAGASPESLPRVQEAVSKAWDAMSKSLARRLKQCPGNGPPRYRIWASKEDGERVIAALRADLISIVGESAGETLMKAFCRSDYLDGFGLCDIEIVVIEPREGGGARKLFYRKFDAFNGELRTDGIMDVGSDWFRRQLGNDLVLP